LPADSQVYVFKSTMADFNYYAQREKIPVVGSADEVKKLMSSGQEAYLIVNEKDLKKFKLDSMFNAVTEYQIGEKKWYLLRLS
jgi:ribosomal protein L32E